MRTGDTRQVITPAGVLTVAWDVTTPDDIRKVIEPILERWLWLVPSWCHELRVKFRNNPGDDELETVAKCEWHVQYRLAIITVEANWLTYTLAEDREKAIVHELVHVATGPLCDQFDQLLEHVAPPQKLGDWADARHGDALEGVVSDLTRALLAGARRE